MERRLKSRSNAQWREALLQPDSEGLSALRELEEYLRRVLARVVGKKMGEEDRDELVQESLARIVQDLSSFRGDSAFTTWATAVATRVAFTELRRQTARAKHRGVFEDIQREVASLDASTFPPELHLSRRQLLQALDEAIRTKLTERQRVAIVCELRGLPTIEIAERLGTNQNALYKLIHDARKKLREALAASGYSADSLHEFASESLS